MSSIPEQVLSLARVVRDEGGRALLVGGCVRDRGDEQARRKTGTSKSMELSLQGSGRSWNVFGPVKRSG